MRKKEREVIDISDILEIIRRCDVCRLGLNDGEYPYIIPLNFGLDFDGEKITLYFHSALEGKKVDLIKKNSKASFEMDCNHELQYIEDKGYCTMAYESVMGGGKLRILNEDEKLAALQSVMEQYHADKNAYFNKAAISRTLVYCLDVEFITAKRKEKK